MRFRDYMADGATPDITTNFIDHLHNKDVSVDHLTEERAPKSGPNLMDLHKGVQFYDYTKNVGRVLSQTKTTHPENYHLSLSHTGSGAETNDHHVAMALDAGHVVATVYQRRKYKVSKNPEWTEGSKQPKTLRHPIGEEPKGIHDIATGKRYHGTGGDKDDNTFDRHEKLGLPHTRGIGHDGKGVASTLEVKGVSNARAGDFANKIGDDGYIKIDSSRSRAETKKKPAKEEDINWEKMPNASRIRDLGQADMKRLVPEGTHIAVHMRKGLANAYDQISTMQPKELKARTSEARAAYHEFRKSRGVAGKASLMDSNGKTEKSSGEGVSTIGLAMAPHHLSGLANVCPHSTAACRANCLGTEAGSLRGDANVSAKMIRTQFVHLHPEHAGFLLHHEITKHTAAAKKKGFIPGVRLNMISDIDHENIHK